MEESSDPQPAGLEAAGAGRSGAAAPERVAISLLGGDWTEENRLCGWLNFNVHTLLVP